MTAAEMILEAKAIRERLRNPPKAVKDTPIDLHPHRDSPSIVSEHPRPSKWLLWTRPEINQIDHMFQIPHFIDIIHFPEQEIPDPEAIRPTIYPVRVIQKVAAKRFGLHVWDLRGISRRKKHLYPRHLAIYVCHKYTKRSSGQLGEDFQRDHSTILHAIEKIEGLIESGSSQTIADLAAIEDMLFDQHNSRPAVAPRSQSPVA